jgi:hypothetical protein
MKNISIIFAVLVAVVSNLSAEESLRTEKKVLEGGTAIIEETFRGDQKILRRMVLNGAETITYFRDGKPVLVEGDDDGDGFRETILVIGDSMDDFEEFTRQQDGQVVPIPTKQKEEKTKVIRERTTLLKAAVKEATESQE